MQCSDTPIEDLQLQCKHEDSFSYVDVFRRNEVRMSKYKFQAMAIAFFISGGYLLW